MTQDRAAEGRPSTREQGSHHTRDERRSDPERVLAFTDGVFAIIITILVLDIRVPDGLPEQSLAEAIGVTYPTLLAWVISFLLTGMYWVWHRDTFALVRRVNRDLVWLNLLFLLPIGLIPFAASVLGQYNRQPVALHVYGVVMMAASLMRIVLYRYVSHRPQLLWATPTERARRLGIAIAAAPIAVYGTAMLLAGWLPGASLALYGLMPLLYFVGITLLRNRRRFRSDAEDYS